MFVPAKVAGPTDRAAKASRNTPHLSVPRAIARWHALCSKNRAMTKLVRFLFLSVSLWVAPAGAQTISLPTTAFTIEREKARSDEERPLDISRQDCLDGSNQGWNAQDGTAERDREGNTWIVMEPQVLNTTNPTQDRIEVWVSETADCTTATARENNRQCWLVYRTDQVERNNTLIINPRDVVAGNKSVTSYTPSDPRPESVCSDPANLIQRNLTIYLLYRTSNDSVDASFAWEQTMQDLAAPPPPDDVTVGPGDENLFFEWDIESSNEDVDTLGFVFYCIPEGTMAAEEEPPPEGTGGEDGTGGDEGTGGAGTGGDEGTGGDPATSGEGGMGGAPTLSCGQNIVVDGEFATAEAINYECGRVLGRSARRGQAKDVTNNINYAVAVAAIDNVGNSGQLKVFDECLMPQEVTTFFEGYEEAGGKGGGGFCGFDTKSSGRLFWLLALSAGALSVRRRKHARRRKAA